MVAMKGSLATQKEWRKGPWIGEEDKLLCEYVSLHGEGRWSSVAKLTGLNRSGKSCRLRWVNYLRPGLKKAQLTPREEEMIIELHAILGGLQSQSTCQVELITKLRTTGEPTLGRGRDPNTTRSYKGQK
ncbi:hypothetical protein GLYMA_18G273300v4 [Glycine max]|nr:hypothetical protein GLYMA_18G273300v4 [Glycine max]KAH1156399.1 hypothetical protein GYH30_051275 [Glycine max]